MHFFHKFGKDPGMEIAAFTLDTTQGKYFRIKYEIDQRFNHELLCRETTLTSVATSLPL